MSLLLLGIGSARPAAERLALELGGRVCDLQSRRFPDGEHYLRVPGDVSDAEIALVAHLLPVDEVILDIVFLADLVRELGARRVGLVAPYLAYMRQDTRFAPGEAVTSVSFSRLLSRSVDWLATVDPHLHRHASLAEIYAVPTCVVSSAPPIAQWVRAKVTRPLIVGPDGESRQWVEAVARLAGCPAVVGTKRRLGDRRVEIDWPPLDVWRGHTPVLLDDIASSGQTLAVALRGLASRGLAAGICIAVHGLFADGARELLARSGAAAVLTCNTLPASDGQAQIDVLPGVACAVRDLLAR